MSQPGSKGIGGVAFKADGSEVVRHDPGKLPEILEDIEDRLGVSECNVFVRAGGLVQVSVLVPRMHGMAWRPPGALTIHPVEASHLTVILTGIVSHEKFDSRSEKYKTCKCRILSYNLCRKPLAMPVRIGAIK